MVADAALQGEAPRETADMPVVEEQATDATWFISMLEEEIVVAPFLQRRICRCAVAVGETVAGRARGRMPLLRIVFKSVVRRQVEAAAEPPDWQCVRRFSDEETHVRTHGRHVRIARMKANPHCHAAKAPT